MTIYYKVDPQLPSEGVALEREQMQELALATAQQFDKEDHANTFAQTSANVFGYPFMVIRVFEREHGLYRPQTQLGGSVNGSLLAKS